MSLLFNKKEAVSGGMKVLTSIHQPYLLEGSPHLRAVLALLLAADFIPLNVKRVSELRCGEGKIPICVGI